MALTTLMHTVLKVGGEVINAITLLVIHHLPSLFHVTCCGFHPHLGSGVKLANERTTQWRATIVNHNHRLVAHDLSVIDKRI